MSTETRPNRLAQDFALENELIPRDWAGKWVAWSADGLRIVGVGETLEEAERKGIESGEPGPILERAPGLDRR